MSLIKRACSGLFAAGLLSASAFAATVDLPLIQAVRSGDPASVRALLKARPNVNAPQGDGSTALHWAVHLDDAVVADLLLRAGARANAATDLGVTPLYLACTNRNTAMVTRLLDAGANPNAALMNGETVLMNCARTGDAASVKALLVHKAAIEAKEPLHGQTALMWAAAQRHPDVVRVLIEAGADIRARSRVYGQMVTISGLGVQARTERDDQRYVAQKGGSTPLLFAARSGDVESARLLLAAGADVNDVLPTGMSALVEAAYSGNGELAAMLLEKGANANAAEVGYTALHAAVLKADLPLVKALLSHGANPNLTIVKPTSIRRSSQDLELPVALVGATPYFLAAKYLELDIMRTSAAAGADTRKPLANGITPLMAAAGMGASRSGNRRGTTATDGAIIEPESQVVDAVAEAIKLGAEVGVVNQNGETALFGATGLGYDGVVQLLADHGADVNLKNKRGLTPLAVLTARDRAAAANGFAAGNPIEPGSPSTEALLRKLGGQE